MATRLKISQGTVTDIERGRNSVSRKVANKLSENYNVSQDWLYTGIGEMFTEKNGILHTINAHQNTHPSENGNLFWERYLRKEEPEKDSEWQNLYTETKKLLHRSSFLYQRIADVEILINKVLEKKKPTGFAVKEADLMHSVYKDEGLGYIRARVSTKEELNTFIEELQNLIEIFDSRFFDLFNTLYRGLRTDLKY